MTDEQYLRTQRDLLRHAFGLSQLDLDAFLRRAREAWAAGEARDPTAYRHGPAALAYITRLAEDALRLKAALAAARGELVGALADAHVSRGPESDSAAPDDPCAGGGVL